MLQVANIASIAAGTVIRYLAYRRWVFPAHATGPPWLQRPHRSRSAAGLTPGSDPPAGSAGQPGAVPAGDDLEPAWGSGCAAPRGG